MKKLLHGDCLSKLTKLEDESVDLIATDPPYGYDFMGQGWDRGVASAEVWKQCLRVMKPGAFAFVMSTPRQDLLAQTIVNLSDAGFDITTTSMYWAYTSGRPVAVDVGKMVDEKLGVERKVVATVRRQSGWGWQNERNYIEGYRPKNYARDTNTLELTEATSEEAKALDGSYSHFKPKPATEVIVVAKKPNSEPSAVNQAMANGKGVTWLDAARIPFESEDDERRTGVGYMNAEVLGGDARVPAPTGRFPANILCSDRALGKYTKYFDLDLWWTSLIDELPDDITKRLPFIFCKKAGIAEKGDYNLHPTVKPIKLMCYLIMMGCRIDDVVLDPFCGSGTTLIAAKILGRGYIGIEQDGDYLGLINRRLSEWDSLADLEVKRSAHRTKRVAYDTEPFVS